MNDKDKNNMQLNAPIKITRECKYVMHAYQLFFQILTIVVHNL